MSSERSLAETFLRRVASTPQREAFRAPNGAGWQSLTWAEAGAQVRALACGLHALGLRAQDCCAILSSTRLEWILIDCGILAAGGATTTIYPSSTAEDCAFILSDSAARVAFVENAEQLGKLRSRRAELPDLEHVILIEGSAPEEPGVKTLEAFEAIGRAHDAAHPGLYEERAGAVEPGWLATLAYTSGTTGRPKGVELLHDNWLYEADAIEALGMIQPDDLHYLWLPLSHMFGKLLEVAQLRVGFATVVDGRIDKLVDNLALVRPTFVAAVPRVFEKIRNRVLESAEQAGPLKRRLVSWAFEIGRRVSALRRGGEKPSLGLTFCHALADRLVFSALRARFGGRLRFFVSGSAALGREVTEFFHAAGILICEGYGLTEATAASVVNRTDRFKLGSVGLPLRGTELRIAEGDGEILLRGRGVMRGYHHQPEATREVIDADGWFHTGDIGALDPDGFLYVTDRKKDLIKTSTGKYVAPQAIDGRLKAQCPYVSQVLVHGNGRPYCVALITLDGEAVRRWARERGLGELSPAALASRPEVEALIGGYVERVNAGLAHFEAIKKFALLEREWSVERGELTASLKVRRKVVEQSFKQVLDRLYA